MMQPGCRVPCHHACAKCCTLLSIYCCSLQVEELDLEQIPRPEEPSDDFLVQLRSFTPWRIACNDIKAFKSF